MAQIDFRRASKMLAEIFVECFTAGEFCDSVLELFELLL